MDFKDLEYFAAIARCGNITRAAQQLYVSQPTLSKFLQKLEGDTGLVLFQRAGRRLELTYAGQRYLAHAERLLSQKREMDAELTDLLRADTGVLHVGMPPFRCSFSLPEVLPAFRAQFPQVQFRIEEAPSAELDRKLLEGEIDLAFYMSFARHPGLSYRVLRRDRMYAVFGKGHPLEQAAAREGIIKPGCPVVSYGGAPEADAVLRRVAAQQHASFTEVDFAKLQVTGGDLDAVTFSFDGLDGVRLPLIGSYQPRNAALAITALRVLRQQGWNIPESAIRTGLEQVSWPGRFELLRHSPAFVLDGSHNAHGMRATVQSLKDRFPGQKFVFLVSIMADKDVDEMLALLAPLAERFVTVTAHNPRAMPAQTLAEHIRAYGCTAEAADSIEAGVARAEELGGEGPVCALGTLYFSGDVRQAFAKINKA